MVGGTSTAYNSTNPMQAYSLPYSNNWAPSITNQEWNSSTNTLEFDVVTSGTELDLDRIMISDIIEYNEIDFI